MKKLTTIMMMIFALICAVILMGCASTEASWGGEEVVKGSDGFPLVDKDGKVQVVKHPVKLSAKRHWFESEVSKARLGVKKNEIEFDLNGYNGDTSEQFGVWTKEMWSGLGVIARLAAAAYNPASSAVPLSSESANGENVSQIIKAKNDADVALMKAKNELAIAKMNNEALKKTTAAFVAAGGNLTNATTTCENGSCTISDGTFTCKDGSCCRLPVPSSN